MPTDVIPGSGPSGVSDTSRAYASAGRLKMLTLSFTAANGNSKQIECGFSPTYCEVINETDVILWKKHKGMAAANAVKVVTAGTTTVDTGSHITFNDEGAGRGNVLLDPTIVPSGKNVSVLIFGD